MAQKSTSNLKNEYPLFVRAQDGSEFSLHWDVDTDPDSLLDSAVKSNPVQCVLYKWFL